MVLDILIAPGVVKFVETKETSETLWETGFSAESL